MWPLFVLSVVADTVIGHLWPPQGDSQSWGSALLVALLANLIAVVVFTRGLAMLLRRRRRDLPMVIARDYVGRSVVLTVSAVILAVGLVHHASVASNRVIMHDAIVRAQAFIGDRAPVEFRRNLSFVSVYAIEPGQVYRTCVISSEGRTYCVIVDMARPYAESVRFDGYTPNAVFSEGVG